MPALQVKGLGWKVPPIEEKHFTVNAFHRVISHMGQSVDFAWIDVCCIDQEDSATKMYEIGRQAGIFKQATHAYGWLNFHTHRNLQGLFDIIFDLDNIMSGWELWKPSNTRDQSCVPKLRHILSTLESLMEDPWFTSLWTLQEAVLRRDAMILSTDGWPLTLQFDRTHKIRLEMFCNTCWNILVNIDDYADEWPSEARPLTSQIHQVIRTSGLFFTMTNNPNVQYGMAYHRVTKRPLDRVYAIIQIYGFRLGESLQPGVAVTLGDLELQLAQQLTFRSSMLSQWFVHTARPPEHRSWMISQRSHVPFELILYPTYSDNMITRMFGTIEPTPRRTATFSGFARPLYQLDDMCRKELKRFRALYFALDAWSTRPLETIQEPRKLDSDHHHIPQGSFRKMFEREVTFRPGAQLQAFLLGDSNSTSIPYDYHRAYAVILVRESATTAWRRIGLVWWETVHCEPKPTYHEFVSFGAEVH
ncbi:unnamed protein product [Aureobasidium uvarum]|uniref:Heterokaryon incompatibility domain-containing protein n=1 Tax=Aureobasidium uvarum TaxID=2773716 RepID=A0A9N8KL06_9PEZI|nr:unnamed protein product [Aureobasidium uvarum]